MNLTFRFLSTGLAAGIVATVAAATPAQAQQGSSLAGKSLASALVQSRAQVRLMKADDKAAGQKCMDKQFVDAKVVTQPKVVPVSQKVSERKWQEQWTLQRCNGNRIGYRVFFTEVGDGGAYFSFAKTPNN